MKSEAEQRVERMTLGLVLLALAVQMFGIFPNIDGLGALLMGIILLGSAYYQRSQQWQVGTLTWVVGAILLALGLVNMLGGFLIGTATAIAALLLGAWLVGRGFGVEV